MPHTTYPSSQLMHSNRQFAVPVLRFAVCFTVGMILMLAAYPAFALTRLSSAEEWQAAPREEQEALVSFFLSGLRFSTESERRRFVFPVSDETFLIIKRHAIDPSALAERMHQRLLSQPRLRQQAIEHLFLATVATLDRATLQSLARTQKTAPTPGATPQPTENRLLNLLYTFSVWVSILVSIIVMPSLVSQLFRRSRYRRQFY